MTTTAPVPREPTASSRAAAANPYVDHSVADYLDSFEGLTWPQPVEQPQERAARGAARARVHDRFERLGVLAPGLVLAAALA